MGGDERTIAPTPRRLAEARQGGHAPRSRELTSAVAGFASIATLFVLGGALWNELSDLLPTIWSDPVIRLTETGSYSSLTAAVRRIELLLAVILVAPAVAAVVVAVLQGGFRLAPRFPVPNWVHLNPLDGIRRLRSGIGVGPLGGLSLKLLAACLMTGWMLNRQWTDFAVGDDATLATSMGRLLLSFGLVLSSVLAFLAFGDWYSRRRRFLRSLRMTVAESRAELRTSKSTRRPRTRQRHRVSNPRDGIIAEVSQREAQPVGGVVPHLSSDPLTS